MSESTIGNGARRSAFREERSEIGSAVGIRRHFLNRLGEQPRSRSAIGFLESRHSQTLDVVEVGGSAGGRLQPQQTLEADEHRRHGDATFSDRPGLDDTSRQCARVGAEPGGVHVIPS